MKRIQLRAIFAAFAGWLAIESALIEAAAAPSFEKDVAPILVRKCLACHNPEKSKGGYQLHTFEALGKPGESKSVPIIPGDAAQSRLFQLIATADEDDRMPQKDDALPREQIRLIEQWINLGANFDGPSRTTPLATLVAPSDHPAPPERYARPVPILALAFNPNGGQLAASGYHEVTLWNPTNGALLGRWTNAPQRIHALAFNSAGNQLIVGGGSPGILGEARLFDVNAGGLIRVLARTRDAVLASVFTPDGTHAALAGADNTIRLVEVASGREKWAVEWHADWVMSLAISPDGKRLVSASRDKTVRILDLATGELEFTYAEHAEPVFAVAMSPDGTNVCTGGREKAVHVWRHGDGKKQHTLSGFGGDIHRLLWHRDGIISAASDGQVREHAVTGKKPELLRSFEGHGDHVYALAMDADGTRLASGDFVGEVRVWQRTDGQLIHSFIAAPGRNESPRDVRTK